MLNVHRLRLLRELHHRGTLSAVAEALNYSPSTISHQLDALQREAGAALLESVGRRVRLTAEALLLVTHAEQILSQLEQAEAELAAMRGEASGVLRLATFQTAAHSLLLNLLGQLDGSALRLDITHLEAQRAFPAVLAGDFDMALGEEYPGIPLRKVDGLEFAEVCHDSLLLALPRGTSTNAAPLLSSELGTLSWAVETNESPAQEWALRMCRTAGFEPNVICRSDDVLLHARLVESGRAAAFLPALVRQCGFAHLTLSPLPGPPQQRRILTVVRSGSTGHPAVQRVQRALRDAVAGSSSPTSVGQTPAGFGGPGML